MELLLERKWKRDTYTIGILSIDGKRFSNTMEDKDRGLTSEMSVSEIKKRKVYGQTAIPTGRYKVILSFSNKFRRILPEILNVKGYTGVRIHPGNTAKDSAGCIIPGENKVKGGVVNSRETMRKLMAILDNTTEGVWLTIK